MGADVVIKGEESPLRLQHDGERGELLRGGADVRARVLREGQSVGEVGHAVRLREQRAAVAPRAHGAPGRVGSVEAGHDLIGELVRLGGHGLVPQQGDLVAPARARGVLRTVLPGVRAASRDEQLERVRARVGDPPAEALDAPPESAEASRLVPVRAQHPPRHVDGHLVHLAEHEPVRLHLEGVARGVSRGERAGQRAPHLQPRRLLRRQPSGGEQAGDAAGGKQAGPWPDGDAERGSDGEGGGSSRHRWAPVVGAGEGTQEVTAERRAAATARREGYTSCRSR